MIIFNRFCRPAVLVETHVVSSAYNASSKFVFGTLFNVLTIGLSLYGLSKWGALGKFEFTFKNVSDVSQILSVFPNEDVSNLTIGRDFTIHPDSLELFPCLTVGSLIAAVDPVAVLAIFEQIKVIKTSFGFQF